MNSYESNNTKGATVTTRPTIADRVREYGIRMTFSETDRNPSMGSEEPMDHYRCRLSCDGRRMSVIFSKGVGHKGAPPTAEEVVSCLASDAAGFDNARSFSEWCAEYGYDTDSRKAERTYRTIGRQRDSLYRLLEPMPCAFNNLLWHTEPE